MMLLHVIVVKRHPVHGRDVRQWQSGSRTAFVRVTKNARRQRTHTGMGAHPRACIDELVAADGTGVGDLSFAHGGRAHAGPSLAELVDLIDDAAQVTGPVLVQAGSHGKWDG